MLLGRGVGLAQWMTLVTSLGRVLHLGGQSAVVRSFFGVMMCSSFVGAIHPLSGWAAFFLKVLFVGTSEKGSLAGRFSQVCIDMAQVEIVRCPEARLRIQSPASPSSVLQAIDKGFIMFFFFFFF